MINLERLQRCIFYWQTIRISTWVLTIFIVELACNAKFLTQPFIRILIQTFMGGGTEISSGDCSNFAVELETILYYIVIQRHPSIV